MAIELNPIGNPSSTGGFNTNFQKIEDELNDNVLRRDGVGQGEANHMEVDLDLNGHSVLNASTDLDNDLSLINLGDAKFLFVEKGNAATKSYVDSEINSLETLIDSEESARIQRDSELTEALATVGSVSEGDLTAVQDVLVATSTGSQSLQGALDQRVIYVASVGDLQSLNTDKIADGQAIKVTSTRRAGDFIVKFGDYSSEVLNDPQRGIWIPFTENSSGDSLVAMRTNFNSINFAMFGLEALGDQSAVVEATLNYAVKNNIAVRDYSGGVIDIASPVDVDGGGTGHLKIDLGENTEIRLTSSSAYMLLMKNMDSLTMIGGVYNTGNNINLDVVNMGIGYYDALAAEGDSSPKKVRMSGVNVSGPAGDGTAGSVTARALIMFYEELDESSVPLDVSIRDCVIDNISNTLGGCISITSGKFDGSRVAMSGNVLDNAYTGVRIRNCQTVDVSKNKLVNVAQRGLIIYGQRSIEYSAVVTDSGVFVSDNTISMVDSPYVNGGIILGLNAGVVHCAGNSVYLAGGTGQGIITDVVLPTGEDDRDVRPSTIISHNTVHGGEHSYYSNDSYSIFIGNRSFNPGEYAFYSSVGAKSKIYYDQNYCQGQFARIAFHPAHALGEAPGVVNSPVIGSNIFVDVVGPHIVRSEGDGLLLASRPTTVSDDLIQGTDSFSGVHADIYELDTSGGDITTQLPFAALLPSGTRFRACITSGQNSVTLAPKNIGFASEDVSVSDNTIWVGYHYNPYRITGTPIRFGGDGVLPAPLAKNAVYYLIAGEDKGFDTNILLVAETYQDAVDGTEIDLSDAGDAVVNTVFDLLYAKDGTELSESSMDNQAMIIDLVSGPACWWVV